MPVKMKIKVTRDTLIRSAKCNMVGEGSTWIHMSTLPNNIQKLICDNLEQFPMLDIASNCAITLAVKELFPFATTSATYISPFYHLPWQKRGEFTRAYRINLPQEAIRFIGEFDKTKTIEERINMDELEFEVEIEDQIIEQLPMPDLSEYLKESKTLELV